MIPSCSSFIDDLSLIDSHIPLMHFPCYHSTLNFISLFAIFCGLHFFTWKCIRVWIISCCRHQSIHFRLTCTAWFQHFENSTTNTILVPILNISISLQYTRRLLDMRLFLWLESDNQPHPSTNFHRGTLAYI